LKKQHPSCHHAWKSLVDNESDDEEFSIYDLLHELGIIARREVLRLNFESEEMHDDKKGIIEVCDFIPAWHC